MQQSSSTHKAVRQSGDGSVRGRYEERDRKHAARSCIQSCALAAHHVPCPFCWAQQTMIRWACFAVQVACPVCDPIKIYEQHAFNAPKRIAGQLRHLEPLPGSSRFICCQVVLRFAANDPISDPADTKLSGPPVAAPHVSPKRIAVAGVPVTHHRPTASDNCC